MKFRKALIFCVLVIMFVSTSHGAGQSGSGTITFESPASPDQWSFIHLTNPNDNGSIKINVKIYDFIQTREIDTGVTIFEHDVSSPIMDNDYIVAPGEMMQIEPAKITTSGGHAVVVVNWNAEPKATLPLNGEMAVIFLDETGNVLGAAAIPGLTN